VALQIRHSSFPGCTCLFPVNSTYCLSNSILMNHKLISQLQPSRYHNSSQMTV
jgi:hypothetical protein